MKNLLPPDIRDHSVASIAASLGRLSAKWIRKDFFYRKKAVKRLVRRSGFTKKMSEELLNALFSELTERRLLRLLEAEIGNPKFLDGFEKDPVSGEFCRARGPRLITHVFSGNVPNPAIVSFVLGMLVKSANVGKCSSEDEGFLDIYLESLKKFDPRLASGNFLLRASDRRSLEHFLRISDLVVVYGQDKTISDLRKKVPEGIPFIGYGPKVSFSFYLREAMSSRERVRALAARTARDVWMMDQRGCLSPATVYIEEGGVISSFEFTELLAKYLEYLSVGAIHELPLRRVIDHERIKNQFKIKKIKGQNTHFWQSSAKGRWIVLYEKNLEFALSSGLQVIHVKPIKEKSLYKVISPFRKYLQSVALEGEAKRKSGIAEKLSALGVNRICQAGEMQEPSIFWHHDGRPNLASWVRWTNMVK